MNLHVIEKSAEYRSIPETENEWSTGWWVVGSERAEALVGGNILLHTAQNEPCYLGGQILGYRSNGGNRVEFRFRFDRSLVGQRTTKEDGNWSIEQKTTV